MENLGDRRIGEHPLDMGGVPLAWRDLNDVRRPVATRDLHDAEPVAVWIEAERFGVDGDSVADSDEVGQITFVNTYGHATSFLSKPGQVCLHLKFLAALILL
jgi:hypothetical protein